MNEFVSYLNTLHNASASNEGAYAENIDSDKDIYSGKLKFDRKITEQLYDTLILQALFQCTKPSGVPRGPSHLQFP